MPTFRSSYTDIFAYAVAREEFLQSSLFVIIAQTLRAILFASAIATSIRGLRDKTLPNHEFSGGAFRHAHLITIIAPMIKSRRMSRCPSFDVLPNACFSPLDCSLGTRPSHAAKSRPFRNIVIVRAKASMVMAGPIPSRDIRRAVISDCRASDLSAFSRLQMRELIRSICSR